MQTQHILTNFKSTELRLKAPHKDIQTLLDAASTLVKSAVEFQLSGVNVAVANAMRRVLMSELFVKSMYFDLDQFTTNDPFLIVDYIQSRIRQIPIHQSAEGDITLDVTAGDKPMKIFTKHLKTKQQKIFNPNIEICTLGAHFHLKINIKITKMRGTDFGANIISTGAVCLPLDQVPFSVANETGVRSTMADPHKFLIKFNTNGTDAPKTILINVCNNIINRVTHISKMPNLVKSQEALHAITIPEETDTIGALITRTMFDLYGKQITYINYFVKEYNNVCEIKFKYTAGDKDKMVESTFKKIIKTLEDIKSDVQHL